MTNFERETDDFQPVVVMLNDEKVTNNVRFAVVRSGSHRPLRDDQFVAPMSLGGEIGVRIKDLEPGHWEIFAKVEDQPLVPVFKCGKFRIL